VLDIKDGQSMADREEFLKLYLEAERDIRCFLRMLVRNSNDFEDACQAVALNLWKSFDTYDATRPFGRWARGVAINVVYQQRRAGAREPILFPPEVASEILDAYELSLQSEPSGAERIEALRKCVDALPARSQKFLELRYVESLSLADIAQFVGSTVGASQRALSRIRACVARCVEQRLAIMKGLSQGEST
jgi:RNA polymerase sigma-70 factor, ECF subfamily